MSKANAPTENGGSELGAPTAAWGKKSTANGTISKTNKTNSPPSPATLTTPSSPPALLEGGNLNEILVVSESSESLDSHAVKPPATSTVVAPAKDDWSSMMGAAPISNNVNHSTSFTKKSSSATMKLQQHHTAAADSTTPASQQFGQSQNNVRTSTSRNTGNIISSATKGSGGEVYSKPLSGKDDGIGGVDSAYDADIKLEENGSLGHISCSSDYNEEVEVFFAR